MSDEREMISTLRDCCDNAWYRAVMERAADMIEGQLDVIECYESMKDGVAIRIADLEQRLAAAEARYDDTVHFMDEVRNAARHRNPKGATILDFMAVWNEQYQDKLRQAEQRLAAAEAELENARDAARLIFEKATFIGNGKEYLRFPGWQKIAEMYTWLAQQEDEAAKGGRDE